MLGTVTCGQSNSKLSSCLIHLYISLCVCVRAQLECEALISTEEYYGKNGTLRCYVDQRVLSVLVEVQTIIGTCALADLEWSMA